MKKPRPFILLALLIGFAFSVSAVSYHKYGGDADSCTKTEFKKSVNDNDEIIPVSTGSFSPAIVADPAVEFFGKGTFIKLSLPIYSDPYIDRRWVFSYSILKFC